MRRDGVANFAPSASPMRALCLNARLREPELSTRIARLNLADERVVDPNFRSQVADTAIRLNDSK